MPSVPLDKWIGKFYHSSGSLCNIQRIVLLCGRGIYITEGIHNVTGWNFHWRQSSQLVLSQKSPTFFPQLVADFPIRMLCWKTCSYKSSVRSTWEPGRKDPNILKTMWNLLQDHHFCSWECWSIKAGHNLVSKDFTPWYFNCFAFLVSWQSLECWGHSHLPYTAGTTEMSRWGEMFTGTLSVNRECNFSCFKS